MSIAGKTLRGLSRDRYLYAMSLLPVAWFVVFAYAPMWGLVIAFTRYSVYGGLFRSEWVGLANFREWFSDPYFFRLIRNTIFLGVYDLVFAFPAPILFALLINEIRSSAFKRVTQTISYLPHFISVVVVVGIIRAFFSMSGAVGRALSGVGLQPINFMARPEWFRPLYVGSNIWQHTGWSAIIYLAAIAGINPELYEAAIMDGANRLQRMAWITLPSISATISILLILRIGRIITVGFEKVYLMYSPAVYETADVIATYVYRMGIQQGNFGLGTAIGLFDSVVSTALLVATNRAAKRLGSESLW